MSVSSHNKEMKIDTEIADLHAAIIRILVDVHKVHEDLLNLRQEIYYFKSSQNSPKQRDKTR